ncbi:MAG TPA: hypothetical protein PKD91_00080, partial [Bacteroidia bacterium]|nr:hypothetical protein [Bacteroidia bacterium]
MEYDDVTGFIQTERYYTTDNGFINSEIDAIADQYDIRNRLEERDSRLFKWNLYYDDFHPIQTVAPHPNFNGNINSTKGYYKFLGSPSVQVMNDPGIFNFSIYDYIYDGLGRLVSADAELSSGPSTNSPPSTAGDEIYNYDRIGNITSLLRNDIDGNVADDWTYSYQFGNNRLQEILNINTSLRSYTYDDNGNLSTDPYRNLIATKYGRSNLPYVLEMNNTASQDFGLLYNYLYNINDQRIFKIGNNNTNGGEFYLRDSKGNEMAVFNLSQDFGNAEWTWYVNGSQRAMKYKANIGEQTEVLDPSTVTDFDEVDMLDQENLRIITGIQTSITAGYTLPDKLVKYRLANDTVFHYLLSNYLVYLMDHDSTFIVDEEQGSWQLEDQNSLVPLLTEGESGTRLTLGSIAEIEAG